MCVQVDNLGPPKKGRPVVRPRILLQADERRIHIQDAGEHPNLRDLDGYKIEQAADFDGAG